MGAFADQVRQYVREQEEVDMSDEQIRQAARILAPALGRIEVPVPQYI